MNVWYMNLKDSRSVENRNADEELKFKICIEKSILAIGWGFDAFFMIGRNTKHLPIIIIVIMMDTAQQ